MEKEYIIINRSVELAANSAASKLHIDASRYHTLPTKNSMLICDDNGKLSFVQLCQTQSPDTLSNPKINTQNASLSQRLSIVEQQIYDISKSTEDVETDQMIEMEDEEIGFSGILQIGKMMMKKIHVDIKFANTLSNTNYTIVGNIVSYDNNLQHQDIFCCTFSNLSVNGARVHIYCLTSDFCDDLTTLYYPTL